MKIMHSSRSALAYRLWQVRPPQPSLTVICKQTFALTPGTCVLADEPQPCGGEAHVDDDDTRSLRVDGDLAIFKPHGEWLLAGTCHPPRATRVAAVVVQVGASHKRLAVFGDRHFTRMGLAVSEPEPFTELPLCWERSFGGPGHARNRHGRGLIAVDGRTPLPNLEDPTALITGPGARPEPAGMGPVSTQSPARRALAGTYDARWQRTRWPYFPEDFRFQFFNAAPPDQQIAGYWRGDEDIALHHLRPGVALLRTTLPGLRPRAFLHMQGQPASALREVGLQLDTITIDADAGLVLCLWRGLVEVAREDLADVAALFIADDKLAAPRPLSEFVTAYREAGAADVAEEAAFTLVTPPPSEETVPTIDAKQLRAVYLAAGIAVPPDIEARLRAAEGLPAASMSEGTDPAPPSDLSPETAASTRPPRDPGIAAALRAEVLAALAAATPLTDRDFTGADLSGLDLTGADLSRTILTGATLADAVLERASFSDAILVYAELPRAHLAGTSLARADLGDADLRSADLTGADLSDASLERADLSDADLSDADLTRCELPHARLVGAKLLRVRADRADFSGCDLTGASFQGASLVDASLEATTAPGLDLRRCQLTKLRASEGARLAGADLRGAHAPGARFGGADLAGANLSLVPLDGADFSGASLRTTNLAGASLTAARFCGADLSGASLVRAQAMTANFEAADLRGADLRGACCHGAELWKARTDGARLEHTDLSRTKLAEVARP